MDKYSNFFWAIVFTVIAVFSLIAIFWKPIHYVTLGISVLFAALLWYDYEQTKDL